MLRFSTFLVSLLVCGSFHIGDVPTSAAWRDIEIDSRLSEWIPPLAWPDLDAEPVDFEDDAELMAGAHDAASDLVLGRHELPIGVLPDGRHAQLQALHGAEEALSA